MLVWLVEQGVGMQAVIVEVDVEGGVVVVFVFVLVVVVVVEVVVLIMARLRLVLVVKLSVSMEVAIVGVEVESRGVRGVGRNMVDHTSCVTLREVEGKAAPWLDAQVMFYQDVLP